jgi:hypothetical protein
MTNSPVSRALLCAAILLMPAAGFAAAPDAPSGGSPPPIRLSPPDKSAAPNTPAAAPGAPAPLLKQPPPLMPDLPAAEPAKKLKPTIEVNPLQAVDPESVGVLDKANGGFGVDMWAGASRALVKRLLPQLPAKAPSPPMHDLMRRLLLSTATAPAGESGEPSLLALRVERLAAMAEAKGVRQLLDAAPTRKSDAALARTRVDSLLLASDTKAACELSDGMIQKSDDSYWQKVFAFCQILSDQNEKARLSISLLRDAEAEKDPAFFAITRILLGEAPKKPEPLGALSPLEIAMLRSARQPLPPDVANAADPAVLQAIAAYADADENIRLAAAERAEATGVLSADALAKVYAGVSFKPDELTNAMSEAEKDGGPRARALLYQAAVQQSVPTARAEVLQKAWALARKDGVYGTSARVNAPLLADMTPPSELMWFAADAGRALFVAGDFTHAFAWYDMAASAAARDSDAKKAQAALWAVAALADPAKHVSVDADAITHWLAAKKEIAEDGWQDRAAYALGLLDALGVPVDSADWDEVIAATRSQSETPGVALWTALRDAGDDNHVGLTVLLSMLALGDKGPAGSSPIVAEAVVTNLNAVGLGDDARRIAVEAAAGAGL